MFKSSIKIGTVAAAFIFLGCSSAPSKTATAGVASREESQQRAPAAKYSDISNKLAYACGKAFNYPVTLVVTHNKVGEWKPLLATYRAPGKDATTGGFIRSKEYKMEGHFEELLELQDGSKQPGFVFLDMSDSSRQLLVERGTAPLRVGKKYKVDDINLTTNEMKRLNCILTADE